MSRMNVLCIAVALVVCITVSSFSVNAQQPSGLVTTIPLLPNGVNLTSYAGYFTVNEQYGSNLFYWLFEAQTADPTTAPLLVWLNGGPGSSSMYGLFSENGPFSVSPDGSKLLMTKNSWNGNYNIMFIDNPVGVGMSYTNDVNGFVTNESDVGRDLLAFINAFYIQYPNYQSNPLYICGESYAGKYIPAFSYAIHEANQEAKKFMEANPHYDIKKHHNSKVHHHKSATPHHLPNGAYIPLAGLSIGDGMMDPVTQIPGYGKYLFDISMVDESQRDYMTNIENQIVDLIKQQKWLEAFAMFDPLMMGDIWPYPSYFTNVTGTYDYYNFGMPIYPNNPFDVYLNRPDVKAALHVDSNFVYSSGNGTVEQYLLSDWMQSVKPWVEVLIENYPVLIYNGQNDIILSGPNCEHFLETLSWINSTGFNSAPRQIWRQTPSDVPSGYVRSGGGLTYVQVRQAGHLLPQDQPARGLDMITRFIENQPWS